MRYGYDPSGGLIILAVAAVLYGLWRFIAWLF